MSSMLTENNIVEYVSIFLKKKGYNIDQALTTSQQGIDIIAKHPEKGYCLVEAKGATSSKKESSRFGKEFNANQIKTHVGVAILKSYQTLQEHPSAKVAIALPNNTGHKKVINSIREPLKKSGIKLFFVNKDGSVVIDI